MLTDFYVKDKITGEIHRVGDDVHDSIWVDATGTLHYYNLQNGDGCSYNSKHDSRYGYEFVPSDCGEIDDESKN